MVNSLRLLTLEVQEIHDLLCETKTDYWFYASFLIFSNVWKQKS